MFSTDYNASVFCLIRRGPIIEVSNTLAGFNNTLSAIILQLIDQNIANQYCFIIISHI